MRTTLARQLIPVVDKLRNILTCFGLRPYVVKIVRTKWSGGRRGIGVENVVSETELLPVPKVADLSNLTEILQPVGLDEVGGLQVSKISGEYGEETLRGLASDGDSLGPEEQVYYEIEFVRPDGQPAQLRRFVLRGAPSYNASGLEWVVNLERSHEDRDRAGGTR